MRNMTKIISKTVVVVLLAGPAIAQMHGHDHGAQSAPTHANETRKTGFYATPEKFKVQLDSLYTAYVALQVSLSEDSMDKGKTNLALFNNKLASVDMKLLTEIEPHMAWMKLSETMSKHVKTASEAADIGALRKSFHGISQSMISTAEQFGVSSGKPLYVVHCPMVKGDWLQNEERIRNPYHGQSMLACGRIRDTIISEGKK